jgi:hypothetical protein
VIGRKTISRTAFLFRTTVTQLFLITFTKKWNPTVSLTMVQVREEKVAGLGGTEEKMTTGQLTMGKLGGGVDEGVVSEGGVCSGEIQVSAVLSQWTAQNLETIWKPYMYQTIKSKR